MQAQFVTDVREICALRLDDGDHLQRLFQIEVRQMFGDLKCIQHQYRRALQQIHGGVGYVVSVGDVAEVTDAKTGYRQSHVHDRKRQDAHAANGEGKAADFVQLQARKPEVILPGEYVFEVTLQLSEYVDGGVRGHIHFLYEVEGPDVVQPGRMIAVCVRKKNGVQVRNTFTQHLLPKVGAGVNDDAFVSDLQICRRAQALVAIVQ